LTFILPLACISLGGLFAFQQSKQPSLKSSQVIKNKNWIIPPKLDLSSSLLARAKIALTGLFALREQEVLYAVAIKDDEGEVLNGKHTYQVSGKALDAHYWSITLYDKNHFLVSNQAKCYNISRFDIKYDKAGNFSFFVSPQKQKQANHWLPSPQDQPFNLLLRLYNPSPSIYQNISKVDLPSITKIKE